MTIQQDVKAMTQALAGTAEAECDKEIGEEVAYHLAEIKEVAQRYQEGFKRLSENRGDKAEAFRLLKELYALVYERAIVHAKDLRRPLEELQQILEEDSEA
jgi:uncharacterized protein YdaT